MIFMTPKNDDVTLLPLARATGQSTSAVLHWRRWRSS